MDNNSIAFTPEVINRINEFLKEQPGLTRSQLSREVARWLNWRSFDGSLKEMNCRVALLKLHRKGVIKLPEPAVFPCRLNKVRGKEALLDIIPISCSLSELGGVELIRIGKGDKAGSRIWNWLMSYHYLGFGPLCGAQIRYLIRSEHYGYLGGLSFSSAAWHLGAREIWIGWDERARRQNLGRVVNNSRFLILPHVEVKHLASKVLSLAVSRLAADWKDQYGIEPVLVETFVEKGRFKGICYRAANWEHIGETKGRGRQDRLNEHSLAVKDIYIYPLCRDARLILSDGPPCPVEKVGAVPDWAEEEFGRARMGDIRLTKRLITIAKDFYARPQANIPQACQSRARTKAAYRFFDDKSTGMEDILASHYEATLSRISGEKIVLAVQDTTSLNYSLHPATLNLGPICHNRKVIGLLVHDTMAFNTDRTPLGLMDVLCWARDPGDMGKKHRRKSLPIEAKESSKWLTSYRAASEAQKRCSDTLVVSVGDREADIYELFHLAINDTKGAKLLIRAEHNRLLAEGHLWEYVRDQELAGIHIVHVPRRPGQVQRDARVEIRFCKVILKPPQDKKGLGPLTIWAVLVEETDYQESVKNPLRWLLLTTLEVNMYEQALEKLEWYCVRWGIEIYHRTLKSGCKIEERQLGKADRIESCLAVDMVVAWRIYHLTMLGRETPDVPCTVFFDEAEWKALAAYKTQDPIPPDQPPTLREATRMVASLGGFLGRKGDGEPGTKTLWLGLQRLDDITYMWQVFMRKPSARKKYPVSSDPKYG